MAIDISTTNYAISHKLGYEGNSLMAGIVSNPILFILTKLIGSMVIIFMMHKIIEKNKTGAYRGMRLIIFMMLFVVANNLIIISANALVFSNQTTGATGSINSGNGYFDDDAAQYGYTGSRNIFTLTEATQVWLIEPVSASVSSGQFAPINSSLGTLKDAVVHNGYIYFVDGTTLKKKLTRGNTGQCESTDTSVGGCILTITTGVGEALRVYDEVLYFTKGQVLHHLDADDNDVTDFSMAAIPGGASQYSSFTVTKNNSVVQAYMVGWDAVSVKLYRWTSAGGGVAVTGTIASNSVSWATLFTTSTQVYVLDSQVTGGNPTLESKYYVSNSTAFAADYATTNYLTQRNRAYVGSFSTLGLIAQSATSYETFNSNEAGESSTPTFPSELTYDTKDIASLDSQYYNMSDIYLSYNVVIDSLNTNNLLLNFGDYRWMIALTDPNGVTTDIIQSPECSYSSPLDFTCQVDSTMGIHAPPSGWLQGTWYAKLYEINTVDPSRTLITTSSGFTVLNTSKENQSVIQPPFIPPTAGTAPQAISKIDNFVSWLGMGVNSVSKLLFAMIIIAIAATVGLLKGNGNVAMVFAFVPYAFFTFIDYIPKWVFIIAIILIAIASRAFR